jgi:hypothetical protein
MKYSYCLLFLFLFSCKKDITTEVVITPIENTVIKKDTVNVFMGYKIDPNAKQLGIDYWKNIPVLSDLISIYFHEVPTGRSHIGTGLNTVCGDFNNDGYVDVFAPGNVYNGILDNGVGFLIWNTVTKKFDHKNLFNDKSKMSIIWGANQVVPVYLNNDNYVDLVIFGYIDEGLKNAKPNPVSLAISDDNGGYDLTPLITETPIFTHEGGTIGDLNGDGIFDMVVNYGLMMKILWGSKTFPYFNTNNSATFCPPFTYVDDISLSYKSDNGFGEDCYECAYDAGRSVIADVNKDGKNDIITSSAEDNFSSTIGPKISKVLINQGNGRFNKNSIIELPYSNGGSFPMRANLDYVVDDINGDGRNDIITLNEVEYSTWNIFVYIQQTDGSYKIDNNIFQYTINNPRLARDWKSKLIYNDFNGDGKKDIAFLDGAAGNIHLNDPLNIMIKKRSVFIRTGNQFIEQDFYQFDPYMKSLLVNVK